MAIDTDTPMSPGWWIKTLGEKLHDRRVGRGYTRTAVESSTARPGLDLLAAYLRGDPPLNPDVHQGWGDMFRRYIRMGRLNIAEMSIAPTANRMGIRDFRTSAANDELGDVKARDIMRANNLKVVAREVHDFQLGLGAGYTIVTPPDSTRDWSLITAESPLQCITAHDAATGRTLAGLKLFRGEWDDCDWAFLFLPGELWVARAQGPTTLGKRRFSLSRRWEWAEDLFDDVPGERVAMVRFRNKGGVSEIERHLDHYDRINDKLFNEWYISKLQAFRQRALMVPDDEGDDVDDLDEDAPNPLYDPAADLAAIFTSSPDSLWRLPKDATVWESTPVSIESLTKSVAKELEWLASALGIPLTAITPDAANGSAAGAGLMREEHINKIENRRDYAEGGWAETMGLAFLFENDAARADVRKIEPIWGPLERHSLSEKADAVNKIGDRLPEEAIWTDVLQYSPAEVVERLRPLRAKQRLYAPRGTTPAPAAPPAVDEPEAPTE